MNTGLANLRVMALALDSVVPTTIYAGTNGGGVFVMQQQSTCGNGIVEPGEQCDDGNTQNGDCCSSTCQFESSGTVCRAAAGACDIAEYCTGTNAVCPGDAKSTAVCRQAAGACDVEERCDGTSNNCPADGFASSSTVCRASTGECDVAETCTGSSAACPADVKSTAVCRPAAGPCDVAETCDGVGDSCPVNHFQPGTTVCRPAAGECDVAETCTGSSADCPGDAFAPANSPCADDGQICTRDVCSGSGPTCQHPAGNPGTVCRSAAGPCDAVEVCDGVATSCPADMLQPSSVVCRASAGVCDPAEFCTSVSVACPADAKSAAVCRPAAGPCDVAEACDGSSAACPQDVFAPANSPCTDDGQICTSDVCGGSGPTCQHPAGNAGTVCRAAVGACDVAETCDGVATTCPADAHLPDSDGDSLCDAVDPCTNIAGGRTFALTNPIPKLVLNRINTDTTPGNDHLSLNGAFQLPAGKSFADFNPTALGARIVLRNRLGGTELDVQVAGGTFNGAGTRGWKLTNQNKTWTFTDSTTTPANGIVKVIVYDRNSTAPRRVEVDVTGDNGTYPVVAGDEPVDGIVTLGAQADAAAGLCGESSFVAGDCTYNSSRNQLTCQK